MTAEHILSEIMDQLGTSPALLIGPSITTREEILLLLRRKFACGYVPGEEIGRFCVTPLLEKYKDESDDTDASILDSLRNCLEGADPSSATIHLAKGRWSAVVSLTPDRLFDEALRANRERFPTTREVRLLDDPDAQYPSRSLPIFRLLGNPYSPAEKTRIPLTIADFEIRQMKWSVLLRSLSDYVKNNAIVALGLHGFEGLFEKFIIASISTGPYFPRKYVFLKSDFTPPKSLTKLFTRYGISFQQITDEKGFAIRSLSERSSEPVQGTLALQISQAGLNSKLSDLISKHQEVLKLIPAMQPDSKNLSHRLTQLTDALFRPAALDWEPFFLRLNLSRSLSKQIISDISSRLKQSEAKLNVRVIYGEAGTGKSCLFKEISVHLTEAGWLCFWLDLSGSRATPHDIRKAVDALRLVCDEQDSDLKIAIFVDNAAGAVVAIDDVCSELARIKTRIEVFVSYRGSELISDTGVAAPIKAQVHKEYELGVELDAPELAELPEFLTRVGIADSESNAMKQYEALNTRNASDILCVLWFLVPSTRNALSTSIEDQYLSLSSVKSAIAQMADEAVHYSEAARKAWEICAVSSRLQLGVPSEVLVRSMEISWNDWAEMCVNGAPLWGLVYPVENGQTGEVNYWTRNDVVTTVLLRLINGGSGHAGEVPIIKSIVRACSLGTDTYREFLVSLFVRKRKVFRERFSLEQGRELYSEVFSSLPYEDKTLQHQYGLWLKDKDARPSEAIEALSKALVTPDYPGSKTPERNEHIRTSLAATVVQQAKRNEKSLDSALSEVQEHLRYARDASLFDAHASHVFGSLLLELAQMHADEGDRGSQLEAVSDGLAVIERTFQIGGSSAGWTAFPASDQEMLERLQERLISTFDEENELIEIAARLLSEHGNAAGYIVLGRKRLFEAVRRGKGSEFNEVRLFLKDVETSIADKCGSVPSRFTALVVDLYVRWQIQRYGCSPDWETIFGYLRNIVSDPLYSNDAIKQFYFAVCLFHLGRHEEANVVFRQLRRLQTTGRIKGTGRCYLQGSEGIPKRVAGVAKKSHERWYFESDELHQDIPIRDTSDSSIHNGSVNCYVGFSLLGAFATKRRPVQGDVELPA